MKKGNKSSAANYRLITFTCILLRSSNISWLHTWLGTWFLPLYDLQHGFRERRSCETQLTMLMAKIVRKACVSKQTDLTLLDFSKASDTVNHSKLIWKHHQYGIRGHAPSWVTGLSQWSSMVRSQTHSSHIRGLPGLRAGSDSVPDLH